MTEGGEGRGDRGQGRVRRAEGEGKRGRESGGDRIRERGKNVTILQKGRKRGRRGDRKKWRKEEGENDLWRSERI